ncbi:MAG: exo-alpha-sialidase [Planctomycetales bacterium]|nr:exo-alpha-sialidase [Planctomycetales bacterium]
MPCRFLAVPLVALVALPSLALAEAPHITANVEVYNEPDRFAGWPANNGIWNWGDEIVVGFSLGYHKEQSGHTIDRDRPSGAMQARSLDGGLTWTIETPSYMTAAGQERDATTLSSPVDFTAENFAARFRTNRFYYSLDRCRSWQGPFELPTFGRPELLARTDYIVDGPQQLTAFVAAAKDGGNEGQPLCIRTTDGGTSWQLVGWIGPSPPEGYGYAIMPATVALDDHAYLSMIRRGGVFDGDKRWWIEAFLSPDRGHSWYLLNQPRIDNGGNPATLTRLDDERLALVYGWRHAPYGIRARISPDGGQTWGGEIILRDDGRNWDLGYPRTVRRADGQLVTVYYFNDHSQRERFIAATVWDPAKAISDD